MSTLAKPVSYGPSSAADPNEGRRFGGAFRVSAGLHALAAVLLMVLTLAVKDEIDREPNVFQVVAGPGDNYMAEEAPAGSEAGRGETGELQMPTLQPTPTWTPPAEPVAPVEPVAPPPSAVEPAAAAQTVESPPVPVPNFARNIKTTIKRAEQKVQREIKKQRAADAAAEKAAAEAARRQATSYEQFQKQNAGKTATKPPSSSAGAATGAGQRLDPNSFKRGVTGGTGAGSTGGGGTALTSAQAAAMDRYDAMLIAKLRESHELPPGVSDLLSADVVFTVVANGVISGVRIVRSSGNAEFDQSVLAAFARVHLPPRPDGKTDSQRLTFRIREL